MTVTTTDGGTAVGDKVLVALGRKPSTKDLGVEVVGLEPGELIHVDAHNRVPGHEWLYAIGDINGKALFTHMGKYQARISADHVLGHAHALSHGADGKLSPRVIFTEPQVAAVGHTTGARRGGPGGGDLQHQHLGQRRRLVLRSQRARDDAVDRRHGAPDRRRLHDHGRRDRRLPARGDDRDRRRGAAGAPQARDPELPHAQRESGSTRSLKEKETRREPLEVPPLRPGLHRTFASGGGPFTSSLALCVSTSASRKTLNSRDRRRKAARDVHLAFSAISMPGGPARPGLHRLKERSISRLSSRSLIDWRLSTMSLPRASAISTLAWRSLK